MVRGSITMEPAEHLTVENEQHRVSFTHVSGFTEVGLMIVGIYLKDSEGASVGSTEVLEKLAARLMALRVPWVVIGDWNPTPEQLKAIGWPAMVKGTVVAPEGPTCKGRILDFAVVSPGLVAGVVGMQNITDGGRTRMAR